MSKVSKAHLSFYKRLIDSPLGIPRSNAPRTLPLDKLMAGGAIESRRVGAGNVLTCQPNLLRAALNTLFDIRNLESALESFENDVSKGYIALAAGTTKSLSAGRKRQPVSMRACLTGSNPYVNVSGSTLEVPTLQYANLCVDCATVSSVTGIDCAIICENVEDFDMLEYAMFEQLCHRPSPALIFFRNDGVERIRRIIEIANIKQIWHFGDFDLMGMQIYETNTKRRIPSACFLMPELDVLDTIIRSVGSEELYYKQFDRTRSYVPMWNEGKELMRIIHTHKKVIEQETLRELLSQKKLY